MRIDELTKPISEMITESDYEDNFDDIMKNGLTIAQVNPTIINPIIDVIKEIINQYSILKFRIIPIGTQENINGYVLSGITLELIKCRNEINNITSTLGTKDLMPNKSVIHTTNRNHTETINITDTETKSGYKSNTADTESKNMSENSPINATLGDISTPDRKGIDTFNSSGREDVNYTNTKSKDGTNTNLDIDNDNISDSSPELYEKYYKLLKETSIMKVIYHAINKYVYEFNMVW